MAIRFHVDPADVPPEAAARRLGLTMEAFAAALPDLLRRGFPEADRTTGMYDLDAIDCWRRRRHAHLFGEANATPLTGLVTARDARDVVGARLGKARG